MASSGPYWGNLPRFPSPEEQTQETAEAIVKYLVKTYGPDATLGDIAQAIEMKEACEAPKPDLEAWRREMMTEILKQPGFIVEEPPDSPPPSVEPLQSRIRGAVTVSPPLQADQSNPSEVPIPSWRKVVDRWLK